MKRKIGTLTLISYTNGFDWEVYDEDGECFAETLKPLPRNLFG